MNAITRGLLGESYKKMKKKIFMNFFKIQESPGIKFNDLEAFVNQFTPLFDAIFNALISPKFKNIKGNS